jgi:hypothetical protein
LKAELTKDVSGRQWREILLADRLNVDPLMMTGRCPRSFYISG